MRKPMVRQHRRNRLLLMPAAVAAALAIGLPAPAASAAGSCHPGRHVLARRGGVVLWSTRQRVGGHIKIRVYVCARAMGRAELVASGGRYFGPSVTGLKVAGHFIAFFLTAGADATQELIVFDLARRRQELAEYNGCSGTRECALSIGPTVDQFLLARNGWIAEVWSLPTCDFECTSDVSGDLVLVATNDGRHHYGLDFGASFSPLALMSGTLSWTSDLSGASSVALGDAVVPPASPQALGPCQLLTSDDLAPILGPSSSVESSTRCTYTSTSHPGMTLTLDVQTGLSAAQVSADETALQNAGWDGTMSSVQQAPVGYQNSTTSAGITHQQLRAFENGAEISLDLAMPGPNGAEQLAWLTDVAFARLYGVPVQRTQ